MPGAGLGCIVDEEPVGTLVWELVGIGCVRPEGITFNLTKQLLFRFSFYLRVCILPWGRFCTLPSRQERTLAQAPVRTFASELADKLFSESDENIIVIMCSLPSSKFLEPVCSCIWVFDGKSLWAPFRTPSLVLADTAHQQSGDNSEQLLGGTHCEAPTDNLFHPHPRTGPRH